MADIASIPRASFTSDSLPALGTAQLIDFPTDILWDDGTEILWDDLTTVQWSNSTTVNPDVSYGFSVPKTAYSGEAE
jgi:hypothetical protein